MSELDLLDIAAAIQRKIDHLEKARGKLKEYAENKARTMVEYEKQMTITIMSLRNGQSFQIKNGKDTIEIQGESVTTLKDLAKGICHEYSLESSVSEARYKNCIVQIEAIKAELNGLQSIFRHLDVS